MYKLIEYQLITEYTKKDALLELKEPLFRQKLVVFSGAGISVESGIPSYRDCSGKWVAEDPEEYATAAAFYENPQKVLDYYNKLRRAVYEEPHCG